MKARPAHAAAHTVAGPRSPPQPFCDNNTSTIAQNTIPTIFPDLSNGPECPRACSWTVGWHLFFKSRYLDYGGQGRREESGPGIGLPTALRMSVVQARASDSPGPDVIKMAIDKRRNRERKQCYEEGPARRLSAVSRMRNEKAGGVTIASASPSSTASNSQPDAAAQRSNCGTLRRGEAGKRKYRYLQLFACHHQNRFQDRAHSRGL